MGLICLDMWWLIGGDVVAHWQRCGGAFFRRLILVHS